MGEIRQTNFRIDTEAADAFRALCEKQGMNQAQGFDYLLEVLALNNAKTSFPNRETEIDNFEMHARALITTYLHSLELNESAEARAKEQFSTQLETQAVTLAEYQKQIADLKSEAGIRAEQEQQLQQQLTELQKSLNAAEERKESLVGTVAELKETNSRQIADKDNIISMLTSKLADAESKASEYDVLKKQINALQGDLTQALQTIKDNTKDAEIAQERAVRTAEKTLEVEHRKELDRLRSQNTELLQTIAGIEKTTAEQIRAVEKENALLREELATLKTQQVQEKRTRGTKE